ncbi:MAG TPA: hypothetical protein VNT57_04185, partial [Desulfobacteria bacterium]|nr:hypothetical protein [Desulfobacteria bacterium]
MSKAYLKSYGVYVPAGRLTSKTVASLYEKGLPGFKSTSMPELDEDSLTMAYEASQKCLAQEAVKVDAVILATTSLPFEYKKGSSLLAQMLKIENAMCIDVGASFLASAEALWLAEMIIAGGKENVLVVTSESTTSEPGEETDFGWGAGAAALLVSNEGVASLNFLSPDYSIEAYDLWKLKGDSKLKFRPEMLDDNFALAMSRLVKGIGGKEALKKYRFAAIGLNRSRWAKALGKTGIAAEQVDPVNCSTYLGHLGAANLGINLALA